MSRFNLVANLEITESHVLGNFLWDSKKNFPKMGIALYKGKEQRSHPHGSSGLARFCDLKCQGLAANTSAHQSRF